jgi:hypothetical protein
MSGTEVFAHRVAGYGWLIGVFLIVTAALGG